MSTSEQHLKKRILGAAITVLAIAIVLPIILNTQYLPPLQRAEFPARPGVAIIKSDDERREIFDSLQRLESGEARRAISLPEPRVVTRDDEPISGVDRAEMALDDNARPVSWTLQMGAFNQVRNAHGLRDQLRRQGFKAYTLVFPEQDITRVYVGPMLTRQDAEETRDKLTEEFGQSDIYIRRYQTEP